ncbi:hypothetical protein BDZ91DRAFT_802808 [Kalaharituber pfeilii]|nr:hypothetical protein BDZ91DRAFT_802808 [Kalaharituber pfeilii]
MVTNTAFSSCSAASIGADGAITAKPPPVSITSIHSADLLPDPMLATSSTHTPSLTRPSESVYTYTIDRTLTPFLHPLPALLALPTFSNIDRVAVGAFIFRPPYPPSNLSPTPTTTTTRLQEPTLLLLRRSPTETAFALLWEVPGGGAELPPTDLTLLDSVAREVLEETGLVVTRIAGLVRGPNGEEWIDFRGSTGRRWRKFSFFVEVEGGSEDRELKVVVDKNEHGEWKWVRREEIEGLEGGFMGGEHGVGRWLAEGFKQWRGLRRETGEGEGDI